MLITVVVVLIVLALALWAIDQLPGDPTIKRIVHVLVIVAAVLYVLSAFGLLARLR